MTTEDQTVLAEKQLEALVARVANLEVSGGSSGSADASGAIRDIQLDMLEKLRELRDIMVAEGSDVGTLTKERDQLREELDTTKKLLAKRDYRISHLLKTVDKLSEPLPPIVRPTD